jgi:hypothetical protein
LHYNQFWFLDQPKSDFEMQPLSSKVDLFMVDMPYYFITFSLRFPSSSGLFAAYTQDVVEMDKLYTTPTHLGEYLNYRCGISCLIH